MAKAPLTDRETELLIYAHGKAAMLLADLSKSYLAFIEKNSDTVIGYGFRPFTISTALTYFTNLAEPLEPAGVCIAMVDKGCQIAGHYQIAEDGSKSPRFQDSYIGELNHYCNVSMREAELAAIASMEHKLEKSLDHCFAAATYVACARLLFERWNDLDEAQTTVRSKRARSAGSQPAKAAKAAFLKLARTIAQPKRGAIKHLATTLEPSLRKLWPGFPMNGEQAQKTLSKWAIEDGLNLTGHRKRSKELKKNSTEPSVEN